MVNENSMPENADQWVNQKDRTGLKIFAIIVVIILILASTWYVFYNIASTSSNSLEILVDDTYAPDHLHVTVSLRNSGDNRTHKLLWRNYSWPSPRESGPIEFVMIDSNGKIITDMRNDFNSSFGTVFDVPREDSLTWDFFIINVNTESNYTNFFFFNDSPIYDISNSTGPYELYAKYDTTNAYQDCWKVSLISESVYFDW